MNVILLEMITCKTDFISRKQLRSFFNRVFPNHKYQHTDGADVTQKKGVN